MNQDMATRTELLAQIYRMTGTKGVFENWNWKEHHFMGDYVSFITLHVEQGSILGLRIFIWRLIPTIRHHLQVLYGPTSCMV